MKKINKSLFIAILFMYLFGFFTAITSAQMTAEEIMAKRDDNEYIHSARIEATMVISQGGRRIEKTMVMYSLEKDALVEFTNPADRGSKFLKREDNLWMFFPDAEDIVKISGHMLEQGFMGSDFSYQDMMESDKLTELYAFTLLEDDTFNDRLCYVLEAVAVPGQKVSYYRRVTWIDKERFVSLKEELYAESGRLLKVSEVQEIEEIEGRWLPVQSIMENKLRKDTYTQFIINEIKLNPELDERIFSLQSLR
ncbi:MAG: outer membrane lipoprotein-sorting protein [Atribacterota bacterium]|nr:outer membrane lipoprotein-sorting protein [Atribacterota bacterium]MDD4895400.1 outer membrane lipoprotein-sorting protein [Atribacterota bacterium]MDD5638163.1 outer membrane lipoprotein-sorting protein [Atribacterota bacterium]